MQLERNNNRNRKRVLAVGPGRSTEADRNGKKDTTGSKSGAAMSKMRFDRTYSFEIIYSPAQQEVSIMYKRGFTLIELIVVVAIISLLASTVIPSVGGVMDKARRAKAQAELQSIGTGILAYRDDNNNNWPADPDLNGWNNSCLVGRLVRGGCGYQNICLMPTISGRTRYVNRDVTESPWGGGCGTYRWRSRPDGWYAFVGCYGPDVSRQTCFCTRRAPLGDDLVFYLE